MGDEADVRAFDALVDRFGGNAAVNARFRLRIGNTCRDIVVSGGSCSIEEPRGKPATEIITDPLTWTRIEHGSLSGIEAFAQRRLAVRGSIEYALQFEPLFDRPRGPGFRYELSWIDTRAGKVSALVAGDADSKPLLLLHGLGATKASWLTVVPKLARHYRVVALDLPGFGASFKPRSPYDARWFAGQVFETMDALGYPQALLAGNSMGGRIAQEMAMLQPERVAALVCLCPATAFSKRPLLLAARLARAELGVMVSRLPRNQLRDALKQLFGDPSRISSDWFDAAIDDFLITWKSPWARLAFFAAARNIYLEEPEGDAGFWARLSHMQPPALYVFGSHDYLISARSGRRVTRALPGARVMVWDGCGHVPQLEFPERTTRTIVHFFGSLPARAPIPAAPAASFR